MKLLQINTVCGTGSTGRICADIARYAVKNGTKVLSLIGRGGAPEDLDTYKIGGRLHVYYHALSSCIFDNVGFCSKRATTALIEKIKEFEPDVIHLHNLHGYYINIALLFRYLKKLIPEKLLNYFGKTK